MKNSHKFIIGTAIAGGAGLIGLGLWRAGKELSTRIKVRGLDVAGGLGGDIRFKVDIKMFNHSDIIPLHIKIPFIKILYDGEEIGHTKPDINKAEVPKSGEAEIKGIKFLIPISSLPYADAAKTVFQSGGLKALLKKISLKMRFRVFGFPITITEPLREDEEPDELGFVATGIRKIKSGTEYEHLFDLTKLDRTDPILVHDGDVERTIRLMKQIIANYHKDTAGVAQVLKRGTLAETLKAVFDFAFNHIRYQKDRDGVEQLRRPLRSWADRKQGIDCDCFTIFLGSILYNLGIRFKLRITKYRRNEFQHVYIVVPRQSWTARRDKSGEPARVLTNYKQN